MSDTTDLQTATPGAKAPPSRRRAVARPLIIAIVAGLLAAGALYVVRTLKYADTHPSTDDAQIIGDLVQIAPQVTGVVTSAPALNNQHVNAGDLLATLDDSVYRANYNQAVANLQVAQAQAEGAGVSVSLTQQSGSAQVTQAQGGLDQAVSSIATARADLAKAGAGVTGSRATALAADAGISTAQAGVASAAANRNHSLDAVNSAQAQVATSQAGVRAAQAACDAANAVAGRAQRDSVRYADLLSQGAVSRQTADQAATAYLQAQAQVQTDLAQLAQAKDVVAQRTADARAARQQVVTADAQIAQAKAQLAAARGQAAAAHALIQEAQAGEHAAMVGVVAAQAKERQSIGLLQQAKTAPTQVAVSRSAQLQATAHIRQAQAAVDSAKLQWDYCKIFAPAAGTVSKKSIEVGQLVQPGTQLMVLVPDGQPWVEANFKETQLASIKVGLKAEVAVDGIPGHLFTGKVQSIAAATGATFSLLPPDNATGNFTKVVQRLTVKIVLDSGQPDLSRLRSGLSVVATVDTER